MRVWVGVRGVRATDLADSRGPVGEGYPEAGISGHSQLASTGGLAHSQIDCKVNIILL